MKHQPDWHSKEYNCPQPLPCPRQVMCLHRVDSDHEIIAESGVAQKRTIPGIAPAQPTDESQDTQRDDQARHERINGQNPAQLCSRDVKPAGLERRIHPLRRRPEKTEAGLNCRPKICLGRSQFTEQQGEIKRYNTPNHCRVFERRADQLGKSSPVIVLHPNNPANLPAMPFWNEVFLATTGGSLAPAPDVSGMVTLTFLLITMERSAE